MRWNVEKITLFRERVDELERTQLVISGFNVTTEIIWKRDEGLTVKPPDIRNDLTFPCLCRGCQAGRGTPMRTMKVFEISSLRGHSFLLTVHRKQTVRRSALCPPSNDTPKNRPKPDSAVGTQPTNGCGMINNGPNEPLRRSNKRCMPWVCPTTWSRRSKDACAASRNGWEKSLASCFRHFLAAARPRN